MTTTSWLAAALIAAIATGLATLTAVLAFPGRLDEDYPRC